jgi:hypothetical protein
MEIRPAGIGSLDGRPVPQADHVVSDAEQASGGGPRSASPSTKFQSCLASPAMSLLGTFSAYRGIVNA